MGKCSASCSSGSCLSEELLEMEETVSEEHNNVYCCRVCFEDVDAGDVKLSGLIAPCKCKGTQKYVHSKCLRRWQENVQKRSLTDERAYRCGVCRSIYTQAPPDPRFITRVVHTVTGIIGAAGVSLLAFGLTGSPWPHLLLLLLILIGSRSHALLITCILLAGTALAALHTKGLRIVMRLDGGGRLGLAIVRHGAAIPGLGPGTLLVASEELEHSVFRRSVVLVFDHGGPNGARGMILTQPLQRAPTGGRLATASGVVTAQGAHKGFDRDWDDGTDDELLAFISEEQDSGGGDGGSVWPAAHLQEQAETGVDLKDAVKKRQLHPVSAGTDNVYPIEGRRQILGRRRQPTTQEDDTAALSSTVSDDEEDATHNIESNSDIASSSSKRGGRSTACSNSTTRHYFGGPVGMPGEGVWQEIAVLHNVAGVVGSRAIVRGPRGARVLASSDTNATTAASTDEKVDGEEAEEEESEEACGSATDDNDVFASKRMMSLGNVFVGGALAEVLEKAGRRVGSSVHVFHGVCVWAEGQLEGEIRAGSWGFAKASIEDILLANPEELWAALFSGQERVNWLV